MIEFVKLSMQLLCSLQLKGYNVLQSSNNLSDEIVYWRPAKVGDVWKFLMDLESEGLLCDDPPILVIEDAIKNIESSNLNGIVILNN